MEHQTTPPAALSLEFLTDKLRESNQALRGLKQSMRHLETTLDCIEHWNQEIAKALGALETRS